MNPAKIIVITGILFAMFLLSRAELPRADLYVTPNSQYDDVLIQSQMSTGECERTKFIIQQVLDIKNDYRHEVRCVPVDGEEDDAIAFEE